MDFIMKVITKTIIGQILISLSKYRFSKDSLRGIVYLLLSMNLNISFFRDFSTKISHVYFKRRKEAQAVSVFLMWNKIDYTIVSIELDSTARKTKLFAFSRNSRLISLPFANAA